MTGLDRREFLKVGALAAGAGRLDSRNAGGPIAYGVNQNYYEQFTSAVPGTRAVRTYSDHIDVFPDQWPSAPPGAWTTLSIRPVPARLLSGKLDRQLRELLHSAPPHAELTCWHEAGPGNPLDYPHYITADTMFRVHEYMMHLCQGTNMRYGDGRAQRAPDPDLLEPERQQVPAWPVRALAAHRPRHRPAEPAAARLRVQAVNCLASTSRAFSSPKVPLQGSRGEFGLAA